MDLDGDQDSGKNDGSGWGRGLKPHETLACIIHDDFGKLLKALQSISSSDRAKKQYVFQSALVISFPAISELFRLRLSKPAIAL